MSTKRLVIATPLYPPESGGPATYAALLQKELPSHGWEVELVKFSSVRHLSKKVRHLSYAWKVFRAARRADKVLVLDPVSTGVPAYLAARLARKPLLVRVVGDYAWEQGTQRFGVTESLDEFTVLQKQYPFWVRAVRCLQQYVARNAERVIVPSRYWESLITLWGVSPDRVSVIYNAAPEVKKEYERPEAAPQGRYLVSASRLVPWKGMDGVLRALRLLVQSGLPLPLVIVGDGPECERLEALAKELEVEELVTFTGALPRDEALAYIAHAELFILNTAYEGFSHLLLEACAVKTPVITTPVGGNPELIEDQVTGLLFPQGDGAALAQTMRTLLLAPALAEALATKAHERVASFSKDAMIDGVVRALS